MQIYYFSSSRINSLKNWSNLLHVSSYAILVSESDM